MSLNICHSSSALLNTTLLLLGVLLTADIQALQHYCPDSKVSVHYQDKVDYELVCQGLVKVRNRMAEMGLAIDIETDVYMDRRVSYRNFVDAPPMWVYGIYERGADEIHLSQWNGIQQQENPRTILGLPADKTLHLSVINHELSHAFIHRNASAKLSNTAQEFWAYVLQIDLLPEGYRKQVLSLHQEAFDSLYEINSLQHAANPTAFGVKAYRWYKTHGDSVMRSMLDGTFRPDQLIEQLSY